jgi:hypothetical protein
MSRQASVQKTPSLLEAMSDKHRFDLNLRPFTSNGYVLVTVSQRDEKTIK